MAALTIEHEQLATIWCGDERLVILVASCRRGEHCDAGVGSLIDAAIRRDRQRNCGQLAAVTFADRSVARSAPYRSFGIIDVRAVDDASEAIHRTAIANGQHAANVV